MRPRTVVFAPEARDDLLNLYVFIAERASPDTALGYVERIETQCLALGDFPDRGTRREDLRPGLRTLGFQRRTTIAFYFDPDRVVITRVFHGGRDVDAAF